MRQLARGRVPQEQGLAVQPGGGQQLAVGGQGEGPNLAAVRNDLPAHALARQVPNLDGRPVGVHGRQGAAVGGERQLRRRVMQATQRADLLSRRCGQVPEVNLLFLAANSQHLGAGAKGLGADATGRHMLEQ